MGEAKAMKERGVRGLLLKKSCVAGVPTRLGLCEVCQGDGEVHYMVTAKLPGYMYLCREHYLQIRDRLEKALAKMLREEKLT
jgi:hypothetical protein